MQKRTIKRQYSWAYDDGRRGRIVVVRSVTGRESAHIFQDKPKYSFGANSIGFIPGTEDHKPAFPRAMSLLLKRGEEGAVQHGVLYSSKPLTRKQVKELRGW